MRSQSIRCDLGFFKQEVNTAEALPLLLAEQVKGLAKPDEMLLFKQKFGDYAKAYSVCLVYEDNIACLTYDDHQLITHRAPISALQLLYTEQNGQREAVHLQFSDWSMVFEYQRNKPHPIDDFLTLLRQGGKSTVAVKNNVLPMHSLKRVRDVPLPEQTRRHSGQPLPNALLINVCQSRPSAETVDEQTKSYWLVEQAWNADLSLLGHFRSEVRQANARGGLSRLWQQGVTITQPKTTLSSIARHTVVLGCKEEYVVVQWREGDRSCLVCRRESQDQSKPLSLVQSNEDSIDCIALQAGTTNIALSSREWKKLAQLGIV
ncbi:hypothetical protein [Thaumasiovibrio subtropicus]|uniref:hypothetical protein n=1 Tax=Thaumasiovibrio subtropicus TaxID=1891207 RepID=UPI000B352B44|nr:hypothetical protein [Thaumasiovibrio subtropicus]